MLFLRGYLLLAREGFQVFSLGLDVLVGEYLNR